MKNGSDFPARYTNAVRESVFCVTKYILTFCHVWYKGIYLINYLWKFKMKEK
jgi:hypothetical protein